MLYIKNFELTSCRLNILQNGQNFAESLKVVVYRCYKLVETNNPLLPGFK